MLDVGVGTGIATKLLAERGARVTAVEPGAAMATELRTAHPAIPLVRALGDALPFCDDAGFDLVGYAQAWHRTDPARSVPEELRVLRPGGALALVERPRPGTWTGPPNRRPGSPAACRVTTATAYRRRPLT
ncbi:class I SAM-dependent methyltransferase [Streptomyces sp. NPDC048637]|uniref:class I SAM-dependent methyltransferase n=1 Tax=Streptomyces sp. NPDC048637 TaxID=3155636 RepID=UPI0034292262